MSSSLCLLCMPPMSSLFTNRRELTMDEIVFVTVMKRDSKVIWFLTNQMCQKTETTTKSHNTKNLLAKSASEDISEKTLGILIQRFSKNSSKIEPMSVHRNNPKKICWVSSSAVEQHRQKEGKENTTCFKLSSVGNLFCRTRHMSVVLEGEEISSKFPGPKLIAATYLEDQQKLP